MTDNQLEFHLPAPPVSGDTPFIPARMVNEFVYCPRLAYLMWTQGEWAETGDTVEGHRFHARVDRPSAPLPTPQALETGEAPASDKVVSRSLTLSSTTLGVIAKLDIAEAEDGVVTPVDYKRGKRSLIASPLSMVFFVAAPGHGSLRVRNNPPQHLVRSTGAAMSTTS